jgi:2Fe-2S ferredoxin
MPSITYIEASGESHTVDVPTGNSLMQGAVDNMVSGIVAECGGACSCATCHVFVDKAWTDRTGEPDTYEQEMLAALIDTTDNSRLSCQIPVSVELEGLVVHLPESQF